MAGSLAAHALFHRPEGHKGYHKTEETHASVLCVPTFEGITTLPPSGSDLTVQSVWYLLPQEFPVLPPSRWGPEQLVFPPCEEHVSQE